jgi:class 3 adenylate cyclase
MAPVVVSGTVELASRVEDVWPLIIDTDRMNRLIGMEAVAYAPIGDPKATAARFIAETRMSGFKVRYEEAPFEWTYLREFGVHRRFLEGPMEYLRMRWKLSPGVPAKGGFEGGTTLSITFETQPKLSLLRPVAWLGGRRAVQNLLALGEAIDRHVRDHAPSPFLKPAAPADVDAVARAEARLVERGVEAALAAKLAAFVRDCADADAMRMRPFDLADEWGVDRRALLRAFLHGVPSGLVELRWAIVCPSCRGPSQEVAELSQVSLEGHCQMCDIGFELELDQAVEATFHPHPAVRVVSEQMFCIGGPARTPHVLAQANVEPGAERELRVPSEAGRYRLFGRGGARATVRVEEGGPSEAKVRFADERIDPVEIVVAPDGSIVLVSEEPEPRHVKLERLAYASAAATAHVVSTLPEFRTIFSRDLLKRETPLKVARVAILFSDLTGSTALYTQVGDAAAFRLVDDHFDVLRKVIAEHEGVLVKTMGDAVMAAFVDERACLRAAVACLREFVAFRAQAKHGELTHLKLGLYGGACYVVTANAALDYFGQTVNVSSRLQHLAESGEIVIEARLADDARALGGLEVSEPFSASVKGVAEPLSLVRVRVKAP